MVLYREKQALSAALNQLRVEGQTIGFVPTMGALHEGHLSLIEESRRNNSKTICSIFVNPTQFNDQNDFLKYPVTVGKDIEMLELAGCDLLFLPAVSEIYDSSVPAPGQEQYSLGYLETVLEGKFRPGHFQGVCMVVKRLLEIVQPNQLFLGQKDYQQCMVIKKLVELMGVSDRISVKICPTLREPDGLAMSSRNRRLDPESRKLAPAIFEAFQLIKNDLKAGPLAGLKETASMSLSRAGFRVEYVEIAGANNLEIISEWDGRQQLVVLAAAFLGEVRLIDNMLLNP